MTRAQYAASLDGLEKSRADAIAALEINQENRSALEEIAAYSKLIADAKSAIAAIDAAPKQWPHPGIVLLRECAAIIKWIWKYERAFPSNLEQLYLDMYVSNCDDPSVSRYTSSVNPGAVYKARDIVAAMQDLDIDAVYAQACPVISECIADMQRRRDDVAAFAAEYIESKGTSKRKPLEYDQNVHANLLVSVFKDYRAERAAVEMYGEWLYGAKYA